MAFVLTMGDVSRFRRGKQVASYLGLIPREYSSGGHQRLGSISKQGNRFMRDGQTGTDGTFSSFSFGAGLVLPQQLQVNQALAIGSKNELPRIVSSRPVGRNINRNDTGQTCHLPHKITENVPSVPDSLIPVPDSRAESGGSRRGVSVDVGKSGNSG
jgi:hypothetical protein